MFEAVAIEYSTKPLNFDQGKWYSLLKKRKVGVISVLIVAIFILLEISNLSM